MPAYSEQGEARRRIRAAYDPQFLREAGHRLADLLAGHLEHVQNSGGAVLNWENPRSNVDTAAEPLRNPTPELDHFANLVGGALSRGLNLHDPRYIGHQVPASVPIAGLFDAIGSVTNQCMAIYEMGPWATAVEQAMVEALGERIGWPRGEFAGLATHGGSLANLTALLAARNVALGEAWERGLARGGPPPVLVAHGDAHYSVTRAAGILGLGTDQVFRAPLDDRRRMDPVRLDQTLTELKRQGHPVIAVTACACATPIGAFDRLPDIAEICRKHAVWMHVDAAHGAAACLSRRYRHLVDGLALADSVAWDAHKMLFVPALCAFVFYRDRRHRFDAFRQDAPYLFDPTDPGLADYDSSMKTVECTKRAAAFGLWGVWSLFGPELFEDMVDVTFGMGRTLYEKLLEAPDFEPLHEPSCNIVSFRHVPSDLRNAPAGRLGQFQLDLRREVVRSGEFYIVPTKADGVGALRVTIINPLTEPEHLDRLLETLRRTGRALLGESA